MHGKWLLGCMQWAPDQLPMLGPGRRVHVVRQVVELNDGRPDVVIVVHHLWTAKPTVLL